MPNNPDHNGISRKISNHDERKRLKNIIQDLTSSAPESSSSIIVRTAGAGHSTLEIKKDYDYLANLWNKIREATIKSKAPCFIHQEDGIILKTVRDLFDKNVKEVTIQGSNGYEQCQKFISEIAPSQAKFIKEYKGKTPIFTKYAIENQIINLYQQIVHLPSGGYIVINPTEALISIDVNSGKATSERNVEETALKTNLEAAKEIAKQAILRDLSGLLVIDFIDLLENKHKKILERSMWEFFSKDKARIQTSNISNFGLLEMSRQRLRPSFLEANSKICDHCSGKGLVRAEEPNAMLILRTIENEIYNSKHNLVNVYSNQDAILYLLNNKKDDIALVEKKHNIKINFYIDSKANADNYSIEKIKAPRKRSKDVEEKPVIQNIMDIYHNAEEPSEPQHRRKIQKNTRKKTKEDSDEAGEEKPQEKEVNQRSKGRKGRTKNEKKENSENVNNSGMESSEMINENIDPSEVNQNPEEVSSEKPKAKRRPRARKKINKTEKA